LIDEIFDRHYQAGRAALNADIVGALSRLGRAIDSAFESLHRIEFSAPWIERARRARPR
jgi:hypothetical protein